MKLHAFPKRKKFLMSITSRKDLQVWLQSAEHLVNIIDYFHGLVLIHYKHEKTVMSELALLANKVIVASHHV